MRSENCIMFMYNMRSENCIIFMYKSAKLNLSLCIGYLTQDIVVDEFVCV